MKLNPLAIELNLRVLITYPCKKTRINVFNLQNLLVTHRSERLWDRPIFSSGLLVTEVVKISKITLLFWILKITSPYKQYRPNFNYLFDFVHFFAIRYRLGQLIMR